ncbi:AbrB/MazE/SpoVT family DNA-binding domain-containing protein [Gloeobacter morelensis]|uniref:AbrB/MazE/SpoVT family DNA-binding domain-containing protein n=1 Tax=Gloeobacter morelensis MG652769 TaxID=2781736 RepID=A0ABY3PQX5_9CYAN|nr:AbrB/MazE/SpoVT family DNA-binding domain-containing protein [Gloeobacter morelensis]UFP96116.1 AbrB/MazE/SpoVT family DNA-binding domain-containing protein [Gloeobacter morelensis MG652769]
MDTLTLDRFGRILIPKKVRDQLGLSAADKLDLEVRDGVILLAPIQQEPKVYYKGGVLVVDSEPIGDLTAVIQELREERIRKLGGW